VPVAIGNVRYGTARFYWIASRWLACPLALEARPLRIGVCASLELGLLRGLGWGDWGSLAENGWWLAPGAQLRAAVQLRRLRLAMTGGPVFPVVRDQFKFINDPEIFRAPRLGLSASIELGWTFE